MIFREFLLPEENNNSTALFRHRAVLLLLILLASALFRLVKLGEISPPGLNQDEAANAWSAYCLLKTGSDYTGASWPVFYVRNLGGNSSSLYVYMLMPFQALGGLNVFTTRLPAALAAVFNTWLIYFCAKRLFNTPAALVAAALLAIDPWDVQNSRWGHDASVTPFLCLAPLALMLWAGLPLCGDKSSSPRPVIAALAGFLYGVACYGYYAVRLFVPVFLLLTVLFTLKNWLAAIKTKKGLLAVAAFFIAFGASFGPLAWQHVFHPEGVSRHFSFSTARINSGPLLDGLGKAAWRYVQHFGPDFLFIEGDSNTVLSPPNMGQFYWYMLPLMLAGLIFLVRRFKSSLSARVIVAFLLAYPAGDCLVWLSGLNAQRSSPGLCGLLILAAVGAVEAFKWLSSKNRHTASALTVIFALVVIVSNVRYYRYFFGDFNRRSDVCHDFHTDFVEACRWLRPRFNDFDEVYCTPQGMNMPYVISTVILDYDPEQWFSRPRDFTTRGEWVFYWRYGKMHFMYTGLFKPPAERQPEGRELLIIRPMKENDPAFDWRVVHRILWPDGTEALWLCVR